MSLRDDLLRLYAENRVADIPQRAEYQTLCREHQNDQRFQAERDQIERAKKALEEWLEGPLTVAEQIEWALSALAGERRQPAIRDIHHQLITLGYKPHWSVAQQHFFDESWKRINLKYDFFLSFTTRSANVAGDNPVNSDYRYFIQHVLGNAAFETADRKKMNLLASCVHRHLQRVPMEGFFYPHSQNDNSVIEKKLAEACADSRVFVQLVQNIMFTSPNERQNYCFFEYQKVYQLLQNYADKDQLILFVVAEKAQKILDKKLVPLEYRSWHNHISSKGASYLAPVDLENKASRIEDLQKRLDDLHTQVEGELLRLTTQVPVN